MSSTKCWSAKRRQGDDLDPRVDAAQLPGGFDAVHSRHVDVHAHDVGFVLADAADEFLTVADCGDDLQVGDLFEQRSQGFAKHPVIVGKHDPDCASSLLVVLACTLR
jgi:hypothetical protein